LIYTVNELLAVAAKYRLLILGLVSAKCNGKNALRGSGYGFSDFGWRMADCGTKKQPEPRIAQ
jgi:hypothetical protein